MVCGDFVPVFVFRAFGKQNAVFQPKDVVLVSESHPLLSRDDSHLFKFNSLAQRCVH